MQIVIAHRGNTKGSEPKLENRPFYIDRALNANFFCEVDLRYSGNKFYLGHDKCQYKVDFNWLEKRGHQLFVHCKNLSVLHKLLQYKDQYYWFEFFYHENDKFTLTSNGYIWTYPGQKTTNKSIIVDLNAEKQYKNIYGICTDWPTLYR